ncbi:MAG: hypothetical protein LBT11_01545, partial [Treponema sp.]|nr:hypothetical protein [Treponema sp.]
MAQELSSRAPNNQKIYPIDSEVYQAIKALYISQGLALPSTAGPWSEAELTAMLDRINPDALSAGERAAYDYAQAAFAHPRPVFAFSGNVTLELTGHTNKDDFWHPDDFILPWNERRPMAALDFETWMGGATYGFFELSIGNSPYTDRIPAGNSDIYDLLYAETGQRFVTSRLWINSAIMTNLILVPPAAAGDIDMTFPYRTFVAAGGDYWSLQIGRDRIAWGSGESGNL